MKILAFHNYASHDAGAAVLHDDGLELRTVTVSEERLSRVKYSYFFPVRAIDYCMAAVGVESLREFDVVVSDYSFKQRLLNTNLRYRKLEADYIKTKLDIDYRKVTYVDHHLAHAASAFYPSGFDEAAVLIIDGVGSEGNTNSLYVASRVGGLRLVEKTYGMGIGLLYTLITRRVLNFGVGEEGKTMGLAALGSDAFDRRLVDFGARYEGLVTDFSAFMRRTPSVEMLRPLPTCEDPADVTSPFYARLAWELQDETERCLLHLARYAHERTGCSRLCLAGGVALNCVANERVMAEGPFLEVFVQPAASDTGIPLGLALQAYYGSAGPRRSFAFRTAFTGRQYEASATAADWRAFGIPFRAATVDEVAEVIARRQIVGWCVGQSELGPRALGHRSILADPRDAGMKAHLNASVKHREMFRPFAPSVLEEKAEEFFVMTGKSPFMLRAPRVRPEKVAQIPAVVHVDGSARVQTVSAAADPEFYGLIAAFERLTGVPVVLNTSFNDNGEPIVETPLDALICFLRTQMDYVYVDGLLVARRDVPDPAGLLARLLDHRRSALELQYRDAVGRLCRDYHPGEMLAFLRAYHPMHGYYARLHPMVRLQEVLGTWRGRPIYTDRYHAELIARWLPEEYAHVQDLFVLVDDSYDTLPNVDEGALVVLFNLAPYLGRRAVVNFYEDLSWPIVGPLFDEQSWSDEMSLSGEYRRSRDWDAFYGKVLERELPGRSDV